MITQKYLKECLHYNPETGAFAWLQRPENHFKSRSARLTWNSRFSESKAGSIDAHGYLIIKISGRKRKAHHIAWFIVNGNLPAGIDHIDGDRLNNRIENIRESNHAINAKNQRIPKSNKSGIIGVCWHKHNKKWHAQIGVKGKTVSLGFYSDLALAEKARAAAEKKHGYHCNHGRA